MAVVLIGYVALVALGNVVVAASTRETLRLAHTVGLLRRHRVERQAEEYPLVTRARVKSGWRQP